MVKLHKADLFLLYAIIEILAYLILQIVHCAVCRISEFRRLHPEGVSETYQLTHVLDLVSWVSETYQLTHVLDLVSWLHIVGVERQAAGQDGRSPSARPPGSGNQVS